MSDLKCRCCDWLWQSQEAYDDHVDYMMSMQLYGEDLLT